MNLREAIRSRSLMNLEASLRRSSIRQELMAKNAANGAGPLMLAVSMGRLPVFQRVAAAVKQWVRSARSQECSTFSGFPMGHGTGHPTGHGTGHPNGHAVGSRGTSCP